jgi:putative transposase
MPDFRRKPYRLSRESYIGRNWYFITACAQDRCSHFRDALLVGLLLDALRATCRRHSMDVYAYCFMPDHLHLELVGLAEDSDLVKMMKEFKGEATSEARTTGIRNLWQKGFYDHVLRKDDRADAVAWYIFANRKQPNRLPFPCGRWHNYERSSNSAEQKA